MAKDRRQADAKWRDELTEHVDHIDDRLGTVEQGLRTNTTITQQIAADTSWLREVLNEGAGAIITIINQTRAEWQAWAGANFPSLTAPERQKMGTMCWLLSVAVRQVLR